MKNIHEYQTATPESALAAIRELAIKQAENERFLNEKFVETLQAKLL